MPHNSEDRGLELVLDNRKLIIAFALLMVVCIGCFVFGFIEGKHQGLKAGGQRAAQSNAEFVRTPSSETNLKSLAPQGGQKAVEDRPVREQLDWYKNVNQRVQSEKQPASEVASKARPPEVNRADPTVSKKPRPNGAVAAPPDSTSSSRPASSPQVTYSVQVGAFKERQEAETKAALLKAQGYAYTIDPPGAEDHYFRVKVGKFSSRADAVAMQLRLKKDGFPTLIKTN